ncbi:MAG: TonB-dependent receptor, partial [Bacteroidota bacterium]
QYDLTDLFVADSINQSGNYQFDLIFSPRVALNYRLKENLAIFAQVSHGFSPPGVEETLTPDGLFNPDIQPETGWNYEIGSRGHFFQQRFSYDISIYTMDIRNLLVARRTADDAFVGVNAGQTRHNGVEIDLRYHILPVKFGKTLDLFVTYTLADYSFEDFVDAEQNFSGNELTGVPRNLFNAGLDFHCSCGFYGNLNFQFVDEIPLRDDNSIFSESYTLLNTKVGFQKRFWDHINIDLFLGIQNLSNESYASQVLINAGSFGGNAPRYFYPGLPRNYFGGFSLGFIF